MRVVIAGAGNVGRSIASELASNGHDITVLDVDPTLNLEKIHSDVTVIVGDACEMSTLEEAELDSFDVSIAATGDDKANLVYSLLAKTEFSVPRTVARVNNPHNEWMFDSMWGVDVAVSTPRIMSALVEEAVLTGDLVDILTFSASATKLSEVRVHPESEYVGQRVADLPLPADVVLVAIIRDDVPLIPEQDHAVEDGDQLLFLLRHESRAALRAMFDAPKEQPHTLG